MRDRFAPISLPIWLTDPDYPAPCPCGDPMIEGEPMALVINEETGLRRIVHQRCMPGMMQDDEQDQY